jgi:hypothetical protein
MSDVMIRLWERAEAAISAVAIEEGLARWCPARRMAKVATVAVLRELSSEIALAEEDDNDLWPDSDDLLILAGELEDSDA